LSFIKKGGDNLSRFISKACRLKERIEEYRQAYPYSMDVPNLQNPPEKIVKRTSS
jgi:hypothetical protein